MKLASTASGNALEGSGWNHVPLYNLGTTVLEDMYMTRQLLGLLLQLPQAGTDGQVGKKAAAVPEATHMMSGDQLQGMRLELSGDPMTVLASGTRYKMMTLSWTAKVAS